MKMLCYFFLRPEKVRIKNNKLIFPKKDRTLRLEKIDKMIYLMSEIEDNVGLISLAGVMIKVFENKLPPLHLFDLLRSFELDFISWRATYCTPHTFSFASSRSIVTCAFKSFSYRRRG